MKKILFALIVSLFASSVLSEFVFNKIVKKPLTIGDLSAAVTGLLLALNLPSTAPIYVPIVGAAFAHNFLCYQG